MQDTVVLDSSVFNKLFLLEGDRSDAIGFLNFARKSDLRLMAPSLFVYEVLAVAAASPFGAGAAFELIQKFRKAGFDVVELDESVTERAIEIANNGHPKTGFPTFYDSAYHALALTCDGVFLTSDSKHSAKTTAIGGVVLLRDWKMHFLK